MRAKFLLTSIPQVSLQTRFKLIPDSLTRQKFSSKIMTVKSVLHELWQQAFQRWLPCLQSRLIRDKVHFGPTPRQYLSMKSIYNDKHNRTSDILLQIWPICDFIASESAFCRTRHAKVN
jgi:hypothetical protein